jgi:hypothetical protein
MQPASPEHRGRPAVQPKSITPQRQRIVAPELLVKAQLHSLH